MCLISFSSPERAESLSGPARGSSSIAREVEGLAHDLRNVMASLQLCAEVLAQPGVLVPEHAYVADEMRLITDVSVGLLRELGKIAEGQALRRQQQLAGPLRRQQGRAKPVREVMRGLDGLLAAVADSGVAVQMQYESCRGAVTMATEDLTRVLVNLVRNACDAMPRGGRIEISARVVKTAVSRDLPSGREGKTPYLLLLTVQDDGPGIAEEFAACIFEPGFSTKRGQPAVRRKPGRPDPRTQNPQAPHRGLGLAIARELVESAGGALRLASSPGGACFELLLPLTGVIPALGVQDRIDSRGEAR